MWARNGLSSTTAGASPEYWTRWTEPLTLDQKIDHARLTKSIVAGWYFKSITAL
jgi:hypothetical protein